MKSEVGDTSSIQITTHKLKGHNYPRWVWSLKFFLLGIGKRVYIDGSKKKPKEGEPRYDQWVLENFMVMTWLVNSMKHKLSQRKLLSSCSRFRKWSYVVWSKAIGLEEWSKPIIFSWITTMHLKYYGRRWINSSSWNVQHIITKDLGERKDLQISWMIKWGVRSGEVGFSVLNLLPLSLKYMLHYIGQKVVWLTWWKRKGGPKKEHQNQKWLTLGTSRNAWITRTRYGVIIVKDYATQRRLTRSCMDN